MICIIHELGHMFFIYLFGCEISGIVFYGAGIKIKWYEEKIMPFYKDLLILSGGCLVNIVSGIVLVLLYRENLILYQSGAVSLAVGAFNLLPVSAFDGGKILRLAAEQFSDIFFYNSFIIKIFSAVFLIALVLLLFLLGIGNLSLYLTLIYFAASEAFAERS